MNANFDYSIHDYVRFPSYRQLRLLQLIPADSARYKNALSRIVTQFESDFRRVLESRNNTNMMLLKYVSDMIETYLTHSQMNAEVNYINEFQGFMKAIAKNPKFKKDALKYAEERALIQDNINTNTNEVKQLLTSTNPEHYKVSLEYIPEAPAWFITMFKKFLSLGQDKLAIGVQYNGDGDNEYTFYTINRENIEKMVKQIMDDREQVDEASYSTSDADFIARLMDIQKIQVYKWRAAEREESRGRFFKYTHKLNGLNLERYGIYQTKNEDAVKIHCIYAALKNSGLNDSQLQNMKKKITALEFPESKLKELAEELEICIKCYKYFENSNKWKPNVYGDKTKPIHEICLVDNHYFVKDKNTNITRFALDNYEAIKDEEDWNTTVKIIKSKKSDKNLYKRDNRSIKHLDSGMLVKELLQNKDKFLEPISFEEDDLKSTMMLHLKKEYTSLEYGDKSALPYIHKDKREFMGLFEDKQTVDYFYDTKNIKNPKYIQEIEMKHYNSNCSCSLDVKCDYQKFRNGEEITIPETLIKMAKRNVKHTKDQIKVYHKIFWDVETYKHGAKLIHKVYYIGSFDKTTNKYNGFRGIDCVEEFLEYLPKYSVLWAHNAGYDFRFILGHKNVSIRNYLKKGNGLYTLTGNYKSKFGELKEFIIKDTYKFLSYKLDKFKDIFKLDIKKEILPYDLYSKKVVSNPIVPLINSKKYLKSEDDYKELINNALLWNTVTKCESCNNTESDNTAIYSCDKCTFDSIEYSARYCEMDCRVLEAGYSKFLEWIYKITNGSDDVRDGLNIDNYVSISSMVDAYLKKEGCYDGTYRLTGIPQDFISKSIVGGRTMCANNKKIAVNVDEGLLNINEANIVKATHDSGLSDFDAVSLYPSAMSMMKGFLKGKPKVITPEMLTNKDLIKFLNEYVNGYFVEIEITKIGINRAFPLQSTVNENGIRMFSNDLLNKKIVVDNIALKDLVEFQKAEFKILRGYYFDDGYNTKIVSVIKNLFESRVEFKKQGNPIQEAIKLMMNSSYGKTILKAPELDYRIFNSDNTFIKYYCRNSHKIKAAYKLANKKYIVYSYKSLLNHYNYPQIGTQILAMSKRIMNEVMCLAEDNDIPIYYQDTDSMHIVFDQVDRLAELFKRKYNRELIGKNMGQFHTDFEMKDTIGDSIRATQSIFLGKKSYIDVLEGISYSNKDSINKGFHIRMKGIPSTCITNTAKKMNITPLELYIKHFKGDEITYDLANDSGRVFFKSTNDMNIRTQIEFIRKLSF